MKRKKRTQKEKMRGDMMRVARKKRRSKKDPMGNYVPTLSL